MPSGTLRQRLEERSDDELLEISRHRDTDQWQEVVFPLAEDILRGRGLDVTQALARAPESESEASPIEDPLIPIIGFATVVESEACRSALLAAGFKVVGADEFVLRVDPAMGLLLGGFRLAVPQSEVEDARKFLAAAEAGELAVALGECSACGSAAVVSERVVNRTGTFINTFFTGPVVQDVTITFRCGNCGATWQ